MCHWLFTRTVEDMIHTGGYGTPPFIRKSPKTNPERYHVNMEVHACDSYRKAEVMERNRFFFFSYYDMSEYESGMTSPGDRKQQDKSTDIMICQADVNPVRTATLDFTHNN